MFTETKKHLFIPMFCQIKPNIIIKLHNKLVYHLFLETYTIDL